MLYVYYNENDIIVGSGSASSVDTIGDNYIIVSSDDLKYKLIVIDDGFGGKKVERGESLSLIKTLSKYEFRNRFVMEEKIAIENYETNGSLTNEQKSVLKVVVKDMEIADEMNLEDIAVSEGLDILISYGLLESSRKSEILEIRDTP